MDHPRDGWAAQQDELIGVGLYLPAEAGQLTGVPVGRIVRWLRGHNAGGKRYERLWRPQVDLRDGRIYLGFRDLMEVRVADAFIRAGLSPQKVRRAIEIAAAIIADERPLSTHRFLTDGRTAFLQVVEEDGAGRLVDVFRSQHAFREIIEPSLKNIDYDEAGIPARWWPRGKAAKIVVDPLRSFGRPIEVSSAVPAAVLAAAAEAEGSIAGAAAVWKVPTEAIRRAVKFQADMGYRMAA